jgi:hypothetical protein
MPGRNGNGHVADPPIQLGPNASWEELARAYGTLAAGLYEKIPQINAAVERIEAAVIVADSAAHRALAVVRVLELRVGGVEDKAAEAHERADEAHRSSHELERYLAQAAAETGRILDRRTKDPNDHLDSERARAIAEQVVKDARKAAGIEAKVEAYDQITKDRQRRRERIIGIAWKAAGAVVAAAALGLGAILWGQFQRAAGRVEGAAQQVYTSPATSSPPVVPLPFEPTTNPATPHALDAGRKP